MSDNDFTLDELELIQDNLHWSDCPDKNQRLLQLNNKLNELIKNYCEHNFEIIYDEREEPREFLNCCTCGFEKHQF